MSNEGKPVIDPHASGVATGMREAIERAGPLLPLRDERQLEMLSLDANARGLTSEVIARAPRGRGRPVGSRNKQTREVRSYILSRYAHPLEVLAQIYTRPVEMLAAELGCQKMEAASLIKQAAAEALPYLEGKMPHQEDKSAEGDFNLLIPGVNIAPEDARQMAEGTFVLGNAEEFIEGDFVLVPENGTEA